MKIPKLKQYLKQTYPNPTPKYKTCGLTEEQRGDIREWGEKGLTLKELASEYGVSISTIQKIVNDKVNRV